MNILKTLAVSLLSFAYLICPALAKDGLVTGNTIYEACTSDNTVQFGYCVGYIMGLNEGLKLGSFSVVMQASDQDASKSEIQSVANTMIGMCAPPEVEYGQFKDIFVKYLNDNPEDRHLSARVLFHSAITKKFPCT